MKIIRTVREMKKTLAEFRGSIGFVPTMGTLHQGHLNLVAESLRCNELSVVSIFVNPAQFNEKEDFENYPDNYKSDEQKLKDMNVDILFYPLADEMYQDNYRYKVTESEYSKLLCGLNRPGHFDGVLTVILKFLNIIKPTNAYFGAKDFQQYRLIKEMVAALFLDVEIIALDTVREESGLAMSSRNNRLSPEGMKLAGTMNPLLRKESDLAVIREILEEKNIKIDYLEEIDGRRYIAAKVENIRLIDNVQI